MLTAIEALYLKTYRQRYGSDIDLADRIVSEESIFFNSSPNSEIQSRALIAVFELMHLQALEHLNAGGSPDDLFLTLTSVPSQRDGVLGYLSGDVKRHISAMDSEFWYLSNSELIDMGVIVAISPKSRQAAKLLQQVNTGFNSPRMALRSFIMSRVS